jgi:WD40 repeat protein/tRNA A-37 threonylcarbamoyl transferase component Bud32
MSDPIVSESSRALTVPLRGDPAQRLEQLWADGQRPDLGHFLGGQADLAPIVVAAAVQVDQSYRWRTGEKPRAEDYLRRYPILEKDAEAAVEVIYHELLWREEQGEAVPAEEYERRFPRYAARLRLQLEVHRAMSGGISAPMGEASGSTSGHLVPTSPLAAADDDPATSWPAVPGYEIRGVLGRGGMGVVYRAWQPALKRFVALKMIRSVDSDPELRRRFRREAEAYARLQHPHILQVHEIGEHDGRPYCVLELAEGGNLAQKLKNALQPVHAAAALVQLVARAIHAAHGHGIIHRDLKPANILFGAHDTLKVGDFGLAKLLDREGDLTETGVVLGTASYMAPEMTGGHPGQVGPGVDVYALGAILYELLTGRPPFRAPTAFETLELVRTTEVLPPARLQPGLPRDIDTICLKCLEKRPGDRYRTAETLADDLGRFLANQPIEARRVSRGERLARWCQRNPVLASVTALAAAALLALSGTLIRWTVREHLLSAELGAALIKADYRLSEKDLEHGLVLCEQGNVGPGVLWLARALERAPPEGERLQTAIRTQFSAWGSRLGTLRECFDSPAPLMSAALSPDGRNVWASGGDKRVRRWNVQSKGAREPGLSLQAFVREVLWRPDGKVVATVSRDGTTSFWEAGTGKPWGKPLNFPVRQAAWRGPSGSELFTLGDDGKVRFVDPVRGASRVVALLAAGKLRAANISSDGTTILTGGEDKTIRFWDARTGRPVGEPLALEAPPIGLALSLDSKTVLVSLSTHTQVWDAASRKSVGRSIRHNGTVRAIAFSPDGKTYLTGGSDRTARLWDSATGESAGPPYVHNAPVVAVAFSGNGRTIMTASSDGAIRLWQMAPSPTRGLVLQHEATVPSARFSPDGRTVFTASWDETVRQWQSTTGKECAAPIVQQHPVLALDLRRDGQALLTVCFGTEVHVWNTATGKLLGRPMQHRRRVSRAVFSPDGGKVLTGCYDGSIRLWDVNSGALQFGVENAHPDGTLVVAFSPDGQTACTAGADGVARLWDVAAGRPREPALAHGDRVWAAAFSGNGRLLVTGSYDHRARIWDTETGQQLGPDLWHGNDVVAVAFSPDGKTILTGSEDGTARLWDTVTGNPVSRPLAHADRVVSVAFSPDGRTALTGSWDGTARLWDTATGQSISPPLVHAGRVWMVTFSPDGRLALTSGDDATARLWRLPERAEGDPEQIALRAEVCTGLRLDRNDALHVLDAAAWRERSRRLTQAIGNP